MTSLIDLYLEKLLSKMVVDDVQRVEIEKEIRSHLEEAAASAQEKGLTREQAVQEAVLAFGQPSVIARQFGIWWGPGWFYFERIALGILVWFLFRGRLTEPLGSALGQIAVAATVALFVLGAVWKRVEVNGGLKVYRPFRRARVIPFDTIERVGLEKGHLVGWRNLVIKLPGKQILLSTGFRGMKAAGLALETLAGDRVDERAKEYLRRLRLRIRKERLAFKVVMSFTWTAIAILSVIGLPVAWRGFGFSPYFVAAFAMSVPSIVIQANLHTDRSKVGLCWLLAIAFMLAIGAIISGAIGGYVEWSRAGVFLYGAFLLTAAVALWWRGKRLRLLGVALVFCATALAAGRLSPRFWDGRVFTIGDSACSPLETAWLPDAGRMVWLSLKSEEMAQNASSAFEPIKGDTVPVLCITSSGGETITHPLPGQEGDWHLFPLQSGEKTTILRSFSEDGDMAFRSEVYTYDSTEGMQRLDYVPRQSWLYFLTITGHPMWSPNGQYLLLSLPKTGENYSSGSQITAIDTRTHELVTFGDLRLGRAARWISDAELLVAREHVAMEGKVPNQKIVEKRILVWSLNMATAAKQLVKEYALSPNDSPTFLRGAEYAMISSGEAGIEFAKPAATAIMNLANGNRIDLPDRATLVFQNDYDWNSDRRKLAYLSVSDKQKSRARLIVADADRGVVAAAEIPAGDQVTGFRLSPNGKYVFFYRSPSHGAIPRAFPRAEIWNTETGEIIPVRALGGVGGIMATVVTSNAPFELPLWSPDGRYVAYPAWQWRGTHGVFAIEAADWGGWLAGRK